ncbi:MULTISPECIES: Stk1 family PASTA domain-containing Ser/Thr kinase [Veillonella]|jgi:putative serine/threonine-protein kinase prkC|uniref:non-specific serine/threonine protein kinase n=1 Tax=Veillonella tobetsuensis TaxID=1110546 RepID=A0A2S7ZNA7_9FIRM|nr:MULTISPECIES: Stk1 family PASTA domain-containing Ser/Thr kinase [Veillonella]MBF1756512.1 Stk1 family PASTA domain-containing Ser/Thr kinase [Veillonella tobetsuensis]MDU5083951.1 Stk1 family PASTA domain-containing Ser/Thr kinase [Veillonella sp.]PQL24768.1 Stk1 family PASTA domain-containing Ser/Thr kinase [Veillonella tobetsuensis]
MKIKDTLLDNRYRILSKIGVGGMADVYKGEDTLLGRPVAIKILHANFASDDEFVSRFKREAQAAGKLNHPNIVNMYDVGYDQDMHYIIMEYVDGETLKEYITRHHRLSIDEAVKITISIGEGLEHAHAMGIVHCDIKPHNVIITNTGRVKVTDFGIARAMNSTNTVMYTNSIMGSAHYLSPEQASGKSVDGNTDIYSLGVVLYEMLTGKVPFEGDTPIAVALKHVREKVIPPTRYNPSIPPLLESVVLKALAKNPADRFESISEMMGDLRLSQGFTMGKTQRHEPYDFATQMIPAVDPDTLDDFSDIDDTTPKEVQKKSMLSKIASIPQKYIVLSAAVIFLIAFLGAFLSYGNFWSNTTVDVPNVVGKQVSVAKNILEDKHLRVSTSEVTNTDVPAGQVISQSPGSGEKVKEQRTIHLVVSKGVGDITVPDLSGMTVEQARQRLKDLGLVVGKITQGSIEGKPDNTIVAQSPSGDSKVSKGTTVDLVVNKPQTKKVKMPDVVGMTLKDARQVLGSNNIGVNQISGSVDEKAIVTEQSVKAGEEVNEGSSLNLATELKDSKKKEDSKQSSSNRTKGTVDVTVPSGSKNQELKIVVKDDEGSTVIYDDTNKPGDRIVKNVSGVGNVRIEVYLNGALVQDTTL